MGRSRGCRRSQPVVLAALVTALLWKVSPGLAMTEKKCEFDLAGARERLRKAELKTASLARELAGEEEPKPVAVLAAAPGDAAVDVETPVDIAAAARFHVGALLESQGGPDKADNEDLPGPPHCDTDAVDQKTELCLLADTHSTTCLRNSPGGHCECFREPGSFVAECLAGCWPQVEKALCGDTDGKSRARLVAEGGGCDRSTVAERTRTCVAADNALAACVRKDPPGSCDCLRQSKTARACLAECWGSVEAAMCTEQDLKAEAVSEEGCNRGTVAAKSKACVESHKGALLCIQEGGGDCACVTKSHAVQDCLGKCWPIVEAAICGDVDY